MTTAIIKVKPTPIMELKTGVSSIGKWETGGETDETGATALEATANERVGIEWSLLPTNFIYLPTGSVRFSFSVGRMVETWMTWGSLRPLALTAQTIIS